MLIIPAVDIRKGKVVRLTKGDYFKSKIYSQDPLNIALKWNELGIRRIHIVDLDAARQGYPKNKEIIKKIARSVTAEIEVGGGIRNESIISEYLDSGVKYLVIGSKAYLEPEWFKDVLKKYSWNIILAVDLLKAKIRIKGWQERINKDFSEYLGDFISAGLKTIIYTDIARDGTLRGVDLDAFKEFLRKIEDLNLDVIFSGGLSCKEDLLKIKSLKNDKIQGLIVGKALYEGKIKLSDFRGGKI